jgi:hypothetical protein
MHPHYLPQRFIQLCLPVLITAVIIGYLQYHKPSLPSTMPNQSSPQEVASSLLAEKGLEVVSITLLQSLWAGYGQICRIEAIPKASPSKSQAFSTGDSTKPTPQETHSYILKLITPPPMKPNNEGHTRKILSYQIEQHFYTHLAPQMPASIPVANCLASINEQHRDGTSTTAMILTDLKQDFPLAGEKRAALTPTQTLAALDWLSNFHGFWWSRVSQFDSDGLVLPPLDQLKRNSSEQAKQSIWLNGGYTYLSTRLDEFASLTQDTSSEWSSILTQPLPNSTSKLSLAESVARFLTPSPPNSTPSKQSPSISAYQTLIHGDVKSENLFTTHPDPGTSVSVAFYDFQYVGLGLGVSDLAKFFTCSVPESMLTDSGPCCPRKEEGPIPHRLNMCDGESELLQRYLANLRKISGKEYEYHDFLRHYEVALVDWLRFQASWGFWGNTRWLEARVRYILKYGSLEETLGGGV